MSHRRRRRPPKDLFELTFTIKTSTGVVHLTGGTTALFATMILGPRRGRFHDETGRRLETPREFRGHSVALQMLGTFILWFGWYVQFLRCSFLCGVVCVLR